MKLYATGGCNYEIRQKNQTIYITADGAEVPDELAKDLLKRKDLSLSKGKDKKGGE